MGYQKKILLLSALAFFCAVKNVAAQTTYIVKLRQELKTNQPSRLLNQTLMPITKRQRPTSESSPSESQPESQITRELKTQIFLIEEPKQGIGELQKNQQIEYIEADRPIYAHRIPNDEFYNRQSNYYNLVNAPAAWDFNQKSDGVLVAIIDSGIDTGHADLNAQLWTNPGEIADNQKDDDGNGFVDDLHGFNFVDYNTDLSDTYGHGSMIAGILGATGDNEDGISGVSWNARFMVLKILSKDGKGSIARAIAAIDYAKNHGAKIINASWGFMASELNQNSSKALFDAINDAKNAGILFVSSVGNGDENHVGQNNDVAELSNYPSSYNLDNIISVAAIDNNSKLTKFSNYGKNTVDLAAPGVNIYSTSINQGFKAMDGTSIAAPFVSGALALLWQTNPGLNYQQIKTLLLEQVEPQNSLSNTTVSGGKLNIKKLLEASPSISGRDVNINTDLIGGNGLPPSGGASGGCSLHRY